jgi:hypothetical protein
LEKSLVRDGTILEETFVSKDLLVAEASLASCGQLHKTFFGVIYMAIGILPQVLTEVTPQGVKITP